MRLEDGVGTIVNTDNSPPSVYDQLHMMAAQFETLMAAHQKLGRCKERQAIRVKMDSLEARYKALYKKYEQEVKKIKIDIETNPHPTSVNTPSLTRLDI